MTSTHEEVQRAVPTKVPTVALARALIESTTESKEIGIYSTDAYQRTQLDALPPGVAETADASAAQTLDQDYVDTIIVGAGLSGISALYRIRKLGLSVKIFEAGLGLGGVWYWNRYPGARVDSEYPFYQLSIPEVYKTFNFSQRFPDQKELRRYVAHLDESLQLRKDVVFDAEVVSAEYDATSRVWTVKTAKGHIGRAKYLIMATGILHKRYCPDFPSFSRYKGDVHHSAFWPDKMDCRGKNIAVVGAGATAVQIVQELAKQTADGGSLTVFMRRPSTCIPMQQRNLTVEEQKNLKPYFPCLFEAGRQSHGGFPIKPAGCNAFDHTAEQRQAHLENLWQRGAFNFLLGTYNDTVSDLKANREVYNFWANKVRARITDPKKRDILAPLDPIYPIGTKRPPLERDYYECIDMPHVDVVDLTATPFADFTENGVTLTDGREKEFDAIVLATGFDSFTGSITNMGLKSKDGLDVKNRWKDGIHTYLGIFMNGFPNAFILFGPQAPTAFSNGPTIIEAQADFIADTIDRLEKENIKAIEPTTKAEDEWKELLNRMLVGTLMAGTDSWWNGSNIPGKKKEIIAYAAGITEYEATLRARLDGWQGFEVIKD